MAEAQTRGRKKNADWTSGERQVEQNDYCQNQSAGSTSALWKSCSTQF